MKTNMKAAMQYQNKTPEEIVRQYKKRLRAKQGLLILIFLLYEEQGGTVERNEKQRFCLPEPMKSRYTGYPESWVEFVSIVKSMIRGDERAWFLCSEDYDM